MTARAQTAGFVGPLIALVRRCPCGPNHPQLLELVSSELAAHADAVDPETAAFWAATKRHIAHQKGLEAAGGGEAGGGAAKYSALNV